MSRTTIASITVDTSKLAATLAERLAAGRQILPRMAASIMTMARMKAPLREGPLRASGRVVNGVDESEVSFGNNGQVPYARYQERGSTTGKPWHYTTTGTGPNYLANAVQAAVRKGAEAYL